MKESLSSISIIIPALNEEKNIIAAVDGAIKAVASQFYEYEIILIDDGSTDETGRIMDELSQKDTHVKALHNDGNQGFGYSYMRGIEAARMQYIGIAPGDNEITSDSMRDFFSLVPLADVAIPHFSNQYIRPKFRQKLNKLYTQIVNWLFGIELKYWNGPAVFKRDLLLKMRVRTSSFAFMTDILVRVTRSGHSFIEGRMELKPRDFGESKAFKVKNILLIFYTILKLFLEVTLLNHRQYSAPLCRVQPPLDSWAGNSPGTIYGNPRVKTGEKFHA